MRSLLWLSPGDRRLRESRTATGDAREARQPVVPVGDLDADDVHGRVGAAAPSENVATRALDVSGSRDRVWHRDGAPIRVGTRRRAGPAVDVLVRADQVAVAVGPVDDDLLDLDRPRGRNDVAFDTVEHDTVRAVDTSALGRGHRSVAAREQNGGPRVPYEGELDQTDHV